MDVEVIVEIPQGSRNKYKMDYGSGRIRLDRMLFTSTRYPNEDGLDGKVLSVVARDPRMAAVRELDDVPAHLRAEIGHFFDIYKELEPGTCTEVLGWRNRARTEQSIEAARARARAA